MRVSAEVRMPPVAEVKLTPLEMGKLASLWVGRHAQLGDGGGDTRAGTSGEVDQRNRAGDGAVPEHSPEIPEDGGAADVWSTGASADEAGSLQGLLG